jgi:Ca-activated chloride channel family protein
MTVPIMPLKPQEIAPVPASGLGTLETEKGNLPLESVGVTARLTGLAAEVEVVEEFRNPFDVPLEATYIFPLPPRAAVTAFQMEADGRVIEGVLKERGAARADYDQAIAEGRRASIAEEERPDVFTIRVGNLVPGERVKVRLTLSQPLPYEDGAAEFRFPLVVAPRYIPGVPLDGPSVGDGTIPDTDAVPDASRLNPPVLLPGFPHPVRLSLAATIDSTGLGLREIRSSLHTVETGPASTDGTVTVNVRPGERLDRDFILRLVFDASTSLSLVPDPVPDPEVPERTPAEGTFTLTVLPPEDVAAAVRPRDVVLVLDRSGSMSGWKMVAARRAAARIVDTLTPRDRFTVLAFDTVIERPFPDGLAAATDRNRYQAVEHLSRLEARGGTEILEPMEEALRLLADPGRDRVLVLVTDGQVGNEDQILNRTGRRLGTSRTGERRVRVHTVGIDRAVNAGFLGRLALLGAGRCELVESEDRLDEAMEHIHRRIGSPLVTGVSLDAGDGLVLTPESVTHAGSLYPGVPLVVRGRFRGRAAGTLTVHGLTSDGTPWEQKVAGSAAQGSAPRNLWARAYLRDLEDRYAVGDPSLEKSVVETSLRFGVLCRFTAFVAVDTRIVTEGRQPHRVVQPVELPSGWKMTLAMPAAPAMAFMASPPMGPNSPQPMARPALQAFGRGFAPAKLAALALESDRGDETDPDDLRQLLAEELERLGEAGALPPRERRAYLADLASRLRVLAQMAGGHDQLSALADALDQAERADADLEALWQRALATLAELAGRVPKAAGGKSRKGWWKRTP